VLEQYNQPNTPVDTPPAPTLSTVACPTVYFELQELSFCQVHALNNAHGHQVLTGKQLMDHCHRLAEHNSAWRQAYEPVVGNFSVAAINHWLFHNTSAKLVYQPWARLAGNWHHDNAVLQQLAANGYASCIRV
jgi:hypothetical protein